MIGRRPGPLCSSHLGRDWIDAGTLCRSRSSGCGPLGMAMSLMMGAAPTASVTRSQSSGGGPLGMAMSLVMGAAPETAAVTDEQRDTKVMMSYDIGIIAASPFGGTREGGEIVKLLSTLNDSYDVSYGATLEDGRGDYDGKTIRINADYRGKMFPTALELVHEASHVLWRKNHPRGKGSKDSRKENIDEELHARENQLIFYRYLKEKKGCPTDPILELRLQRQANNTLRQSIEDTFAK